MQGAQKGPSGPRHRVADGPVGYKHGMRAGYKKERAPKDREEVQGIDPRIGRGDVNSDPCQGHRTVPRRMRVNWARAEGLAAATCGETR